MLIAAQARGLAPNGTEHIRFLLLTPRQFLEILPLFTGSLDVIRKSFCCVKAHILTLARVLCVEEIKVYEIVRRTGLDSILT
jgi:hypothetical protein